MDKSNSAEPIYMPEAEYTLDPLDWSRYRSIAHQMVDDMVDFLQGVREQPVWKRPSDETKAFLMQDLPEQGSSLEEIYLQFTEYILPYRTGNIHPRFFSWVHGTGTYSGALADFLASVMNSNLAIGDHVAVYVEKQVLEWCKKIVGFPEESSGILVSGGSLANITALITARNSFQEQIKSRGLKECSGPMVLYCSTETHNCIHKAAESTGIGSFYLRQIPVNRAFQMDIGQLSIQVKKDRQQGLLPFCVVGSAGTVNTGAFDPLAELADFCRVEGLWLHVDAAIGAVVHLLDEYAPLTRGMELADSIAFDLHKWLYINYEAGCVLIRNSELHRKAFAQPASYLSRHERGLAAGPDAFTNYGLELSRGFKALKIWFSIKEHGLEKYRQLIRQNISQAHYTAEKIGQTPFLELLTPVVINIVCYRYNPGCMSNDELNELNKEIVIKMQELGIAAPSHTLLNGKYAIRMAITNHRTRFCDMDIVLEQTLRLGEQMVVGKYEQANSTNGKQIDEGTSKK